MKNQINMPEVSQSSLPPKNLRMKKKMWVAFASLAALILLSGAYLVWKNYFSPEAQQRIKFEENYQKYTTTMNAFEEAMRNDTYGGKTPEKTLQMFIDALKKGDIDLASKYFMLDTNTKSPDYLTRRKWERWLAETNKNNGINNLINLLGKAKSDPEAALNSDYFVFSIRDEKGIVISDIDLRLNKYSQVWKIESI